MLLRRGARLLLIPGLLLATLASTELSAQTAACRAQCDREYGDHPGRFSACVNQCPRYQQPTYSGGATRDWDFCGSSTLGTPEDRIRHCTTLIESNLSPQDLSQAYNNRGLEWQRQKDHDNAIADFTEALKLKPNDAEIVRTRGDSLLDKGDFDEALNDYNRAVRLAPTADNYNSRCFGRAAANRDLQLALADCDQALRRKPNDADALDSRAFVHFRLERFDDAMEDLDNALRRKPGLANSLFVRGVIKLNLGDTAGGQADILAAKTIVTDIAETYAVYGVVALVAPKPAPPPRPAPSPAPTPAPAPIAAADCSFAESHWKSVEALGVLAGYQDHLKRFPTCAFADLAKLKIDAMKK